VAPSEHLSKPLSADLERIVLWCLAKERDARPASAAALLAALLACEDASRYDRAAAFAWWSRRGAELRGSRTGSVSGSSATMAVDLRGRNDAASLGT
jgi:hypothetical protein